MTVVTTNGHGGSSGVRGASSWLLVTNKAIPSLAKTLHHTSASGVLVYGQGAALLSDEYKWDATDAAEELPAWKTSIRVHKDKDLVRIRTAVMNVPPLYWVHNTTSRAWAVGTDAFTLHITRAQWGMPVGFTDPTVVNRDSTTSFHGVSQLSAHTSFVLERSSKSSAWKLSTQDLDDPVFAALEPKITDYDEAGKRFVEAVQKSIADATRDTDPETGIACLLSGGIDSGAAATFAVRAGLKVTAYSAGSPWGNEHEEAQELADYLGIPLHRIELTTADYLAAVPDSMRALATAERERIDIALTITAIMRSGRVKEDHVLTGYGNDLMLIGLPPDSTSVDVLLQDIITEVDFARHSGEFTDYVARMYGKRTTHVYWHEEVVKTALDIHPSAKVHGGREKAFFRAAMEAYIPKTAAWRQKIGIHVGGGLQGGLDALFGGLGQKVAVYEDVFRAMSKRLVEDPSAPIEDLAPVPI